MIFEIVKSTLAGLWSIVHGRRKLRVLIHRARFQTDSHEYYFVNVTNLSNNREVEITHVWFETKPIVHVLRPDRPLPKRLKPDEPWETWISVDELSIKDDKQVYKLGRVRMSTGAIVKSQENRQVPSIGSVPGGSIRPEYANSHPHSVPSEAEDTSSEQQEQQTTETYDVMQVCENGHKITGCFDTKPERRKDFCDRCGEKTITACPNCDKEIQGDRLKELYDGSWLQDKRVNTPSYCPNCGEPYPWTTRKRRKEESIQAFIESGKLDEEEKKTVGEDIENISKNIPDTEPSAIRIKKIWKKYGPIAYEAIMEFASRTAAKILKGP